MMDIVKSKNPKLFAGHMRYTIFFVMKNPDRHSNEDLKLIFRGGSEVVSSASYAGMIVDFILAFGFPLVLLILFNKKGVLSWKPLTIGIFVFIIFSQVLEKLLHALMIAPGGTTLKFTPSPWAFAIYAALAAGVFEEIGRYIGLKWFFKEKPRYGDGLSLGLGHGGMEAILIGAFSAVYAMIFAHMINTGQLPDLHSQISQARLEDIKAHFIQQGFGTYVIAGVERVVALIIQIFLALVVSLSILRGTFKYVIYAIGLHVVFDFVPALHQAGIVQSLWATETVVILLGIIAAVMIFRLKPAFDSTKS
jgi:uncharacterized membrane protein YhfC